MALMVCRLCTAKFAVGLRMCPQCTGESAYLDGSEEDEMVQSSSAENGGTVEGPDGVTRSVDADGNIGDPIHDVEGQTAADEAPAKAPAKKAAAKQAR